MHVPSLRPALKPTVGAVRVTVVKPAVLEVNTAQKQCWCHCMYMHIAYSLDRSVCIHHDAPVLIKLRLLMPAS